MYSDFRSGFFTGIGLGYGMMTVIGIAFGVFSIQKSLKSHKKTQTNEIDENIYREIFDRIG
jgi:prolipoprotein diacylglyceryltransferase